MKKILSLVLILAMALCMFTACGEEQPVASGLEDAKSYLYAMYKDNDEVTAVDYRVVGAVMIDNVSYAVTWSVDNDDIKVVANGQYYNIELPDTLEEIAYTLTATITDAKGKTATQAFSYKVPAAAGLPTTIADGTYVILFGNLTMSSLAEDKGYGYPNATEVALADGAVSGHTAADVLTITNVEGGVTIQDAYGRYFYLKGTYNSFNVDAAAPAEGHVWEILVNGEDYIIVNALNGKTLAYSSSHTSWGAYSELTDDHNTLLRVVSAVAPAPHVHTEVVDAAVAATCTEPGKSEGKHCSDCGEVLVEQKVVEALGHTNAEPVQENLVGGGCGEAGSYESVVKCIICGEEVSRETVEIPATGDHNYVSVVERTEPTCTEPGSVTMACSCGATQTTELDAAHTPAAAVRENETAATFTTAGSYESVVKCSVCGEEISRENMVEPAGAPEHAATPEIGKAYKLGIAHGGREEVLYFTGKMDGYYGATSNNKDEGVDVFVEDAGDGAYYLYFMDGETKNYIYFEASGTYKNFKFGATQYAFTWNAEYGTFMGELGGEAVYMGTYKNYKTFSISTADHISDATSYPAHLYE